MGFWPLISNMRSANAPGAPGAQTGPCRCHLQEYKNFYKIRKEKLTIASKGRKGLPCRSRCTWSVCECHIRDQRPLKIPYPSNVKKKKLQ